MSKELKIIALEDSIHCGVTMLDFGTKTFLFGRRMACFYRMSGIQRLHTKEIDKHAVFGCNVGDEWALAFDVKRLIEWAEERELKD